MSLEQEKVTLMKIFLDLPGLEEGGGGGGGGGEVTEVGPRVGHGELRLGHEVRVELCRNRFLCELLMH